MKKIDTTYWKEFRVGDLFPIIKKPKVYHTREVVEDISGIPYIVRSKFNNGVKYRIKPDGLVCSPKGVISFGAENAAFFYQPEEWCGGRDIYYIDTRNIQPYACMFLASCLSRITENYTYSFGLFPDLLKREKIKLPAKDEVPDWPYMEEYMRRIEQRVHNSVSALKDAKYGLTSVNTAYWKEFSMKELGFENFHGRRLTKKDRIGGNIPFITAGKENQGVVGKIGNDRTTYNNAITVDMFGNVFYHKGEYAGDDNIYFFVNDKISELSKLFIVVSAQSQIRSTFEYKDQFRQDNADNLTILLPAKGDEPDWHYMEMYMRGVEAIVKNKLSLLVPHKPEVALHDATNVTFNNANVTFNDYSTNYNVKK